MILGEFNVKPRKKDKDMWTEVTKDLVLREAIEQMGYSCEETDDFFYIMEYLKYVSFASLTRKHRMLIMRRRMFFNSSRCQTKFVASASCASILSAQLSAIHRGRQATRRSSMSARWLTIDTETAVIVRSCRPAHPAAELCRYNVTRSETPETTPQVSLLEPPHALVSASA
jgi:hypothetical protein